MTEDKKLAGDKKATEYLANERTYLAWVRTSIAVISLGFVVAKFSVWMHEFATRFSPGAPPLAEPSSETSLPLGIVLMCLGGVLPLIASWHYHKTSQAIEEGRVRANRALIVSVAVVIAVMTAVTIGVVLATTHFQ